MNGNRDLNIEINSIINNLKTINFMLFLRAKYDGQFLLKYVILHEWIVFLKLTHFYYNKISIDLIQDKNKCKHKSVLTNHCWTWKILLIQLITFSIQI